MTGILQRGRDLVRRRPWLTAGITALSLGAPGLGLGLTRWSQPDEDAFQLQAEIPAGQRLLALTFGRDCEHAKELSR